MSSPDHSTFVVVGGGIAGVSCAKSLAESSNETIILITGGPMVKTAYDMQVHSRHIIEFKVTETEADLLSSQNNNLHVIEDIVTEVIPSAKTVILKSGKQLNYVKLCICTGAKPKLIAKNNPLVLGIRDTESVSTFVDKLRGARKIAIVGNGGIATELVHDIDGIEIIWIIKDSHISSTFVDPGAAQFFQDNLLSKGTTKTENPETEFVKRTRYTVQESEIKSGGPALGPDWNQFIKLRNTENNLSKSIHVEYQSEIDEILNSYDDKDKEAVGNWPIYVKTTKGKVIGCDLVVSATGVTPNTNIKGLEGLKRGEDGGYLVDWQMQTSQKDIYAAGDICSAGWEPAKHWFQMRLWIQAYQMGLYAARSMLCDFNKEPFEQDFCFELFTHCTKFFGFKVVLLGLYNGQKLDGKYEVLLRVTKGDEYVKYVMVDGKLQGAVLIGDTGLEEMCENLILNQLDLSIYGDDLLNPDIDIEDYFD